MEFASNSPKFDRIYTSFLITSIVSCGISISISQMFLFLSLILFILSGRWKNISVSKPLFYLPVLLFSTYAVSAFIHGFSEDGTYFKRLQTSELKDVLLFPAFLMISTLKEEEIPKIEKAFLGLIGILLFTGLISAFSPIRLSRLLTDWIKPSGAWRLTHHYGDVFKIGVYLPIGLLNTHLTFGGILLMVFPVYFFKMLDSFFTDKDHKKTLQSLSIFLLSVLILLLNNARSAIIGAGVAVLIGLIHFSFSLNKISSKILFRVGIASAGILILAGSLALLNPTIKKTIMPLLGEEKHTDSGRTFIWDSTYPLIERNPILGIGPGNYNREIEKSRKELSEKKQELLFFYEVTQRGHAHNDYLHFAAISGILTAVLYILFGASILNLIFHEGSWKFQPYYFYGLIGIFAAGIFQCYFQDDEVVIVFWYLLGFLSQASYKNK